MSAQGTTPPPPAPSTCWAPPVASRRSPDWHTVASRKPATARGRRIERIGVFMAASGCDDDALHGGEQPQQLVLLGFLHAPAVQRLTQPLDHEVHLGFGVLQPLVDLVHRIPGVLAAAARELADLLDDLLFHARDLHVLERAAGR